LAPGHFSSRTCINSDIDENQQKIVLAEDARSGSVTKREKQCYSKTGAKEGLPQTNIARRSASSAAAIIGAALRSFLGTGDHGGSHLMSSSNKATLAQMEVVAVAVAPSFPFAMPPKRQILCS